MGLKAGLQILQQTGRTVANYADDAARLVATSGDDVAKIIASKTDDAVGLFCRKAKPITPSALKTMHLAPSLVDDEFCMFKIIKDLIENKTFLKLTENEIMELPNNIRRYLFEKLLLLKKTNDKNISSEIETFVDAINELNGKYCTIKRVNGSDSYKYSFIKFLNKTWGYSFRDFVGVPKERLNTSAFNGAFKKGSASLYEDLAREDVLFSLIEYLKCYSQSAMSPTLYNMYLSRINNPTIKNRLLDISQRFGVRIILPSRWKTDVINESLNYIEKELLEWAQKSSGSAKLPSVIDFSKSKLKFYIPEENKKNAAPAFCQARKGGSINFRSTKIAALRKSLRHEIVHANDKKRGRKIPKQYDLDIIMPKCTVLVKGRKIELPDAPSCMYREEFIRAGIPESRIDYAYTNTKEFIARAAEGDMSKYSSEFRQMLIDFGLPDYVFNMTPKEMLA